MDRSRVIAQIMTKKEHRIIIVSDGTGETAAQITQAGMVQFSDKHAFYTRYKNVRNEAQIDAILEEAAQVHGLLIHTIVSPQLRSYLTDQTRKKSIPSIDLMGPLLNGLTNFFGHQPKSIAGLFHDVNERYFDRIEAMEYTIQHDDGRDLTELEKADLVILGISRTSKTPLSMYLSTHGWKVANIPLIYGFEVPKEVLELDQRRVIGLTIDPENLATIRRARLQRLGHDQGGDYANPDKIISEIDFAHEIYKKNRKWSIFNVTGKALEETSAEIMKLMESRRLAPGMQPLPPAENTENKR